VDTTKLIVEYLIVGILVCLGIAFWGISAFAPNGIQSLDMILSTKWFSENAILSALIFLPIAYGIGVVIEYAMLIIFEGSADKIRLKILDRFVTQHITLLKKSKLLQNYRVVESGQTTKGRNKNEERVKAKEKREIAKRLLGEMRFYVMHKSVPLHAEIEAHLNRLRILRALPLAEFFFLLGFLAEYFRTGFSVVYSIATFFLVALTGVNLFAIAQRQERYGRAIVRAYLALIIDDDGEKDA
jgi:hypothetical protein